jgi:hypothetical protein
MIETDDEFKHEAIAFNDMLSSSLIFCIFNMMEKEF